MRQERAEELLHMVEAIGCRDLVVTWDEVIAQDRIELEISQADTAAKSISMLVKRTHVK